MHIDNEAITKYLTEGAHDLVIKACEPIIYHYMHKTGFWKTFQSDRDDMLQEGRIAIFKCIETFDGRVQFTTYVHSAIRNALYSYVRKNDLYENGSLVDLDFDTDNGESDMKTLTMYNTIVNEIDEHKHGDILRYYYVDGHTQKEISEIVGKSQQWVAWVCNDFRNDMREKYGQQY